METDLDSIAARSQDAVVMNMILGCLAVPESHANISAILACARSLLKDNGKLIVVRPNPAGGEFSTYQCLTPQSRLKAGDNYKFIVKGLEEAGAMDNLYTPDDFLRTEAVKAGFSVMEQTVPIADRHAGKGMSSESPAFLLNILRP